MLISLETKVTFKKVTNVFSDCMKVKNNFSEASNYRKDAYSIGSSF